jgi:molybdopterin synthase catalytic subunit
MRIEIRSAPFDPMEELARYRDNLIPGSYGATASFIGTMRDHNEGDRVQAMTLEHYPGMTERRIGQSMEQARRRWDLLDALVIHRVGELRPDDPIVLVAVWSSHRAAAFDACRFIMEALKSRAPFWKKESLADRQRWVEKNTAG